MSGSPRAIQSGPVSRSLVAAGRIQPYFTDAERVALALTEAVLRPTTAWEEKVPDDLYARAAEHYDAKALITLTVAIGQAMFFMPVALIGRPLLGMPPAETWT